jgi:hypothetical protein
MNQPPNLFIQRNESGRHNHEGPPKIYGAHDNTERERGRARKGTYQKKATGTRLGREEAGEWNNTGKEKIGRKAQDFFL